MKALSLTSKIFVSSAILLLSTACAKINFSPGENESTSVKPPLPPNKIVSKTEVVAYGNKQVDFLLVLDDSNSMLPDLKKLSARLSTFVAGLEGGSIDWQMCFTTTRGYNTGGSLTHGPNLFWKNYNPAPGTPQYLLKKGTANLNTIFTSTIDTLNIGGANSADERGIKAAHDNFAAHKEHECYRPGAAVAVIVISDEDERSVGGDATKVKPADAPGAYLPLEPADYPENLLAQAQQSFGTDVRFTFNSIIVKPGDLLCEAEQDKDTSPSHPGYVYEEASRITEGGVGSICDSDYGPSLNTFRDKIVNSLSNLTLECVPLEKSLKVLVAGFEISGVRLEGKILKFSYPLVEGTEIQLQYQCKN